MTGPSRGIVAALRERGVQFELTPFERPLRTVDNVAAMLHVDRSRIGKALLVRGGDGRIRIVAVPGDIELDLATAARCAGTDLSLVSRSEIRSLTSVEAGAVTPLLRLLNPDLHVVLDRRLTGADAVNVSSGDRRIGLTLAGTALSAVTEAAVFDFERPQPCAKRA